MSKPNKRAANLPVFDKERFGRFLRANRRTKDLSQEELADLAGVNKQVVSNLETGRASPSIDTICLLASAFEISPAQILEGGLSAHRPRGRSEIDRILVLLSRFDARQSKEALNILESVGRLRPRNQADD